MILFTEGKIMFNFLFNRRFWGKEFSPQKLQSNFCLLSRAVFRVLGLTDNNGSYGFSFYTSNRNKIMLQSNIAV